MTFVENLNRVDHGILLYLSKLEIFEIRNHKSGRREIEGNEKVENGGRRVQRLSTAQLC